MCICAWWVESLFTPAWRSSVNAWLALATLYWEKPDQHWSTLIATLSSPTTDCLRAAAFRLRFLSLVCRTLKCHFLPKQLACCHFMHNARHQQLWVQDALRCRGTFGKKKQNQVNNEWEQSSTVGFNIRSKLEIIFLFLWKAKWNNNEFARRGCDVMCVTIRRQKLHFRKCTSSNTKRCCNSFFSMLLVRYVQTVFLTHW